MLITEAEANNIDFIISILERNFDIKDIKTHFNNTFNSFAYEINNKTMVRFPRHENGKEKLIREFKILDTLNSRVTLQIPKTEIVNNKYFYITHTKVEGNNINQKELDTLNLAKKEKFCYDIANFIYELNSVTEEIKNKIEIPLWDRIARQPNIEKTLDFVLSSANFSSNEKKYLEKFCNSFKLENENELIRFSHFDIMSKNTAFDFNSQKLNGIYDFGDCSIGDIYHDFSQIGLDYNIQTLKLIVKYYEELTKICLDIQKIEEYSLFSWLSFCYRHQTEYGFNGTKRKIAELL